MRSNYWDIAKGLGAVFVLMGHTGMFLTAYVYIYHVPLFFFIAGYFFKDKYAETPFNYIGAKVKSLWVPAMKYALFFAVFHNLFYKLNFYSTTNIPDYIAPGQNIFASYGLTAQILAICNAVTLLGIEQLCGALWFIVPMFFDLILLCFMINWWKCYEPLKKLPLPLYLAITGGAVYYCGCILIKNNVHIMYDFQIALTYYFPLLLGWYYHYFYDKISFNRGILSGAALLVMITVLIYDPVVIQIYNPVVIQGAFINDSAAMRLIPIACGIAIHLGICHVMDKIALLQKTMAYIGRESLFIIATHFVAFKAVAYCFLVSQNLPMEYLGAFPCAGYPMHDSLWWIPYTVAGLVLPLACKKIFYCLIGKFTCKG